MNEKEILASMNVIQQYEMLQWAVGIFGLIASAMVTAIIAIYRDNRAERKEWRHSQEEQNEKMMQLIAKNIEAFNKLENSNNKLCDLVDRQQLTTQSLERLIIERLK